MSPTRARQCSRASRTGARGRRTLYFSQGSTQCYVASNDRVAFVTFRGTEINHMEDALVDAEFKLMAWDGEGRVHLEFLGALDAVRQPLQTHLATLRGRSCFFTGHSLGAALATLAARRWKSLRGEVTGVYTIGSPRIGDHAFAGFDTVLAGQSFRYVNGADGVTEVPPSAAGYEHVGELYRIAGSSAPHDFFAGLEAPFIDHTPRRYTTLIRSFLARVVGASGTTTFAGH